MRYVALNHARRHWSPTEKRAALIAMALAAWIIVPSFFVGLFVIVRMIGGGW